ncbi:ankyrin-2-like isoform X20 [Ornithodoros turicata]|uniref:ankyrin-2-like isoform X20 n=1 Tax=Ornithodoros turicata TaxID=34597 RepID=UPI0031391EE7
MISDVFLPCDACVRRRRSSRSVVCRRNSPFANVVYSLCLYRDPCDPALYQIVRWGVLKLWFILASRRDTVVTWPMTDGSASFLRAARAGNLEKVLEYLKGSIDINTSNANGLNALHLAAKEGHVNVVNELLKRGANVNAATKKGNTALHIASLAGQEEVVKILVAKQANVNVQSQNGFTPLYMAAQENHDNVVRFLLANGANQSLATEDGFTPLAVALQQGHDRVVAVLLENDAKGKVRLPALHIAAKKDDCKAASLLLHSEHNPDVTSKSGFTPLHIAAHYGNSNIASLLLDKGADVNFPAKHQITPLHVAAKWGKINMVKLLLEKGAKLDASTRDGLTPLHCAARSGHDQVVELLLERNAPITAKTKNGLAPLHMASQGDHVDSARILLYHKAPVDDVTVDYLTALHVAAHCGHVGVAKLLLDRRAEPNARALNGFTPLHIACKKNRIKVVELLLKQGASIEATTESGLTPLHVASFMGCMNIVIYLLQHGANPDIPTVRGETPLHLAARANQTDIIRILLRNGAHVDAKARELQTALHIGARLGNADMVGLLLQHGAAVDAPTKDQYTPLHVAAREGQDEVAALLLDHGASLSASTKKGFTPLHLAAKHGNIKVARLLLQKDAPVDAQGKNGVTPLHVAAHYDHVNVALLLLEKGASPHAAARNGYTPLHVAARKDQMDIASTLLEYGAKPNAESRAGFTPLHLAAQEGHADVATLLVEHGAQCDAKAKNGLTPLHLCAQEDRVNVAAVLAKHGAQIDPNTKAGYTPLHVACHFGQINMIRFLLQHGSNVNATTAHGYTPLHQAAQQGHTLIINLLLEHRASPNATTNQGQTALSIAQRLGYISVVETLKVVTETIVTTTTTTVTEEKYKVVAPETMHETFMSDSEDEADDEHDMGVVSTKLCLSNVKALKSHTTDDNMLGDQSFRYLTADEMKSLGDDSLPIDVTRDERLIESVNVTREAGQIAPLTQEEERLSPTHAHQTEAVFVGNYAPDNIDISRTPVHAGSLLSWDGTGSCSSSFVLTPSKRMWRESSKLRWKTFLVSFLVDARGGAMRGCRHSGVRVIIPPRKAPGPMRITCRYLRKEKLPHPPPLLEGEACASRILEVGPAGAKFLGPVIIEVPHFASLRGKEREITILRSDNGETWKEHTLEASEEAVQEVLNESFEGEELTALEDLHTNRITRILTTDFPQYFAVVTRSRQEVHAIGPEGGLVSSTVVPQVQAIFPEGALTKKIRVGLQAQPIHSDLVTKLLGNRVAVSPIVTVEPRRRKFHKPITLTIPVPQAATKGMINQYSGDAPTLRLLCSITGGVNKAQWEDVTGSTPLTFVNDCVSFTTTVSARFWLMDCRQVNEATRFATELYAEAIHVPFMAKFVVFSKRHDPQEAQLRVFCMTDDKEDKTLETQEHFTEVAKSRDVEVLENKPQYLEFAGNLIPVTKSGEQLSLTFQAFRENRVPFNVRVKDLHQEALGRVAFMKEPRGSRTDPPQTPICNLNIALPEFEASRAVSELVTLEKKYGFVEETGLAKPELIHRADLRLSDIARELGKDWEPLGQQLDIPEADIHSIRAECPGDLAQQALLVLRLWMQRAGPRATGNNLEKGLRRINREDIVNKCMFNVELVTDDVEKAVAKVHLDQSGFDTFREELGTSRNASLKRDTSLNASYDEPDLMKEAESAEETSSETGSVHEKHGSSEAKARKLKKSDTRPRTPSPDTTQVTVIKRSSKEGTPTIALEESFDDPRMENHVLPSERTVITDPTFVVMKELKEPPEASRVPGHDDLITQGELDELVEGVLYPEAKGTEKKQIGPVIVEERELSDAPDSIVKVVSVTKRTVTQLPVTEEVPVQQVGSRLPGIMEGKEQPDVVSTVVTEVEYKSGPEAAGIVSFPTETQERLTHPGTLLPADTSDVRQGDVVITTDPEMMRTVTTTVERFEGEPQELGTTYILSELPDDQTEGTTRVVRTVTREVKGEPSEESVITVQTTTTTSASAPGKQPELSANLLDEMFKDTGKESPYGRILKADEVAKLKSKPGMKKEDLELLDQLFPDQGPSKTAYPPEGLVPENVIIPEYRTFVMAEEPKKPMSPKKKERVLEKIGRALSHDEQEGRQRPRLVRAATVDSATLEESHKEEVQEPPIAMQKVEQSEAKPTVLPAVAESTTPEAAPMEDEPLTKSTEFRTLPSDDAIVTKTTTQFQDVLDDGTVKHTVTTVTRTTIIQEVDEGAPQAEIPSAPPAADVLQQPGAKPGESETWASDLDTSQVSVSSLPEDEKTEPTATLSSATTTAEGASSSEPGVQTQVEEKEWTETDPDSGDVRRVVCKTTHTSVSSAKPTESQQSKDKASDADTQQASDEEESLTFVQKREFFEKLSELSPPKDSRPRLSSTPSLDTTLTRPVATQRPRPRSESLTSQGEIVEESIVFSERLKKFQQNEGALPEQDVFEGFEQAECQLRKVREELEADVLKEAASDSRTRLLEGTSKLAFGQADSRPKPPSEIVGSKTELKLLVRTSEPGKEALDMRLTEYMDTEGRHEEQQQFARVLVRSHDTEGDAYQPKRDDAPSLRASASPIASSPMQPRDFERGESWKPAEKAETPEQTTAQPAASPDNVPSFDRNLCRPEKRSPLLEASPPEETDYNMEQEISPAKEYPDYLTPDMQVSVGVSPTEGFPPCERKYSGGDSSEKSPLPAQKNDDVFVPSSEKVPSTVEAHGFGARYSESSLESSADVDSPKIPLSEPVMAFENVAFAGEDIIDASSEPPDELTSPCGTRSPYEVVRETASEASVAALIKHSEEKLQEEVCAQMKQKLLVSAPDEPPSMHMTGVTITQHVVTEIYTEDVGGPPVDKSPAEIKETLKELFPGGTDYLTAGLNVTGIIRSPISHKGNSDDEDGEEEEWADRVLSKIKDRPVPPTPPASPRTVQSAVEVKEQVTWEAPVEEHIEETVEEVKEIPAEEQVIIEHDEDICKDSSSTQEETTDRDASYEESGVQQEATGKDEVRPHHKRPVLEHIPSEISDEDLVEREQSPTGHPPDTCREWKDDFSSRRDSSPDSDSDKGGGGAVAHGGLPSSTAVLVQSTTGRDEEKPSCSTDKQDKTQAAESEAADEGFLTATLAKEVLSTVNEFSTDLRKDNVKDMSRIRDDSSASVGKISPSEQLSSPPEKKSDSDSGKADAPLVILRNKTKVTRKTEKRTSRDLDTQSGSETDQSHYYSFELTSDSGKTPSRPTSSEFDINVLSGHASSEYDTCVTSQDASYATAPTSSQEVSYATARSSLSGSSRESAYSVDSESSGHLGSLEASEASDTIVASAHEDLESDNESQMSSSILREPYDGSISESVIRSGVEVPFLPNWQTSSSSVSPGQHTSYAHRFHQMPGEMTGDGSSSPFEMILQECVGEYSSTAVTRSLELQQDVHGDTGSTTLERGTEDQMVRGDILNGAAGTSDVTRHTRDDRMAMSHEEEPLSISESSATQSELTWQTSVETTVDMGQARRSSCDADRYQRQSTMADSATYSLPRDEAVVVGDLADLQAELDDVADDDATPPFSEINGPVEVDYVPEYDDPYAVRQRERLQQQGQHRAEGDVQEQQEVLAGHDVQVHQEQHESDAEAAERTQDDDEQDQGLEEGYYTETFESNLSTEEVEGAMSREFLIGSKLLLDRPESEVDIILPGAKDSSYDECLAQDIDLLERPMTPEPPEEIHVSEGGEAKGEAASSFTIEPKDSLLTKQGSSDTSPPISESFEFVEKADVMSIPTEGEHFEMVPGLHTESQLAFLVKEMEVKGHEHAVSPSGEVEYSSKCEEYVTHLHQTYDTSPPKDTENEFICEQAMDVENARLIEDKLTDDSSQQDQDFPFDLSYQHDYSDQERGDFGELYTHQEVEEENYDDERARLRSKRLSPVSDERGSTPDYDTLAGRKTFCRGSEKDDASTSSLQEFERLEAEMAAGKSSSVGSSDSFSGRHFNAKSGSEQDSVSVNSLTEFEKLEKDIVEAENVDGRVRSEIATRLDEIDEGHESQASDPGFDFTECRTVDCDQETMDEIEEIIKQARANVAQLEKSSQGRFADVGQTAETEYTSTKDYPASVDGEDLLSVEPPPEMESSKLLLSTELESGRVARHILLGRTMSGQSYDNGERRSSTSTATNFDTDSLVDRDIDGEDSEANPPSETSAWSLKEKSDLDHDSLHGSQSSAPHDSLQENLSRGEEKDSLQEFEQKSGDLDSLQEDNRQDSLHETRDIDMDSMNGDHSRFRVDQADRQSSPIRTTELSPTLTRGVAAPVVVERIDTLCWVEQGSSIPDQGMLTQGDKVRGDIMVSSTDSLEPSSSANTHATYQFETDSVMSSSLNSVQTSCEESTMVSSTDTLDPEPYAQMAYAPPDSASQHLGMDLAMTMKEVGEKLLESPTEFPSEPLGYGLSSELREEIASVKSYVTKEDNATTIRQMKQVVHQEDSRQEKSGGEAPPDIEEQFKDYLRRTMGSPTDKEEVEERKAVDEYGNVTITRMVKRHITSEPQIHAQTFTGSDAEEKTREFLQSFKEIEPSTEKDEYEGFDADGNPIRVTQKVVVRPTVKTVTFSGPNARAQMEEYMRTHSAREMSSAEDTPTSDSGVGACSMSSPPSLTPDPHTCTDLMTTTSAPLASPGLRHLPDGGHWTECEGLDESGQPITTSRVITTRTTRTIGPDGQEQVVTTTTTSMAGEEDSDERMRRSMQGVLENFMRDQGPTHGSYFEENEE